MTESRQTRAPVGPTTPLQYVKGVGPHRAKLLERKGLVTVGDALFHLPMRHEDRTRFTPLRAIRPGETVTCSGVVTGISPPPLGRRRQPLVILLRDESGYAAATVWGRPWIARAVQRGQRMIVHGRGARYQDKVTLQVQEWETVDAADDEPIHAGALVPVYSSTEGLPQQALRSLIWRLVEAHAHDVEETLPDPVRARRRLVPLAEAVRGAHFPASEGERADAVRRLAFDDFLLLQVGLAILRSRTTRQRGVSMRPRGELLGRLRASLPFSLTAAQERVWDDIRRDMAAPYPMHRLLQGDVGSGKTVVAALAVCAAVEAGYQAAVMAPPIPRTLALTLYGDLDVSVLDELPPGRKPVRTDARTESRRRQIYDFLRAQIADGRQVYVVYPLVEESELVDLKAATDMAQHLQRDVFPDLTVGLLHGRLASEDKDAIMQSFKAGAIQVLVATTVIEVGIDVPNASVMLIEHAERFGLSQLHQLRGRVGRGPWKSYCILLTSGRLGEEAQRRVEAMAATNDGFKIAEVDPQLAGPGRFFGTRQSGLPEFRVADLLRDAAILEEARLEAQTIIAEDAELRQTVHRGLRQALLTRWRGKLDLASVG